jgi:hypothetical protein
MIAEWFEPELSCATRAKEPSMNPLEPWEDAWLNNRTMPSHSFPHGLLEPMLTLAERWTLDETGPRRQLEEFVSRNDSYTIITGLVFSGFCRDRTKPQRIRPIPVLVEMLYQPSTPSDVPSMERRMADLFARALSEWCRLHLSGQTYDVAP